MRAAVWTLVAVATLLRWASACTNGDPCDDGIFDTTGDVCTQGVCAGTCTQGRALVNGACVVLCPILSAPTNGAFVSCSDRTVGARCQATCISPAVPSGEPNRQCLPSGAWSGEALRCTLPDPCLQLPCSPLSVCVADESSPSRYRCDCVEGSTGSPGADGSGCIVPNVEVTEGDIALHVSDQNDIEFTVGSNSYSVLDFDSRIRTIVAAGGTIDTRISTANKLLSDEVNGRIAASQSTTMTNLGARIDGVDSRLTASISTALITATADSSTKMSSAVATSANDASAKSNSALSTARVYTDTSISAAKSDVLSTARVYDSQTASTASTATETVRVSLSSQLSSSQAQTASTLASQSATIVSQSSSISALFSMLAAQISRVDRMQACEGGRQLFDSKSGTCVTVGANIQDWTSANACNSTTKGDTRFNLTKVITCNGSDWIPIYTPPVGSLYNPAASCAQIFASADYLGFGLYWFRHPDGTTSQLACEGAKALGGDGSTTNRVAKSCSSAQTYFGITSGKVLIDPTATGNNTPNPSSALLVYCLNGVSLGGNGSTSVASSLSCAYLSAYFTNTSAMYFINGTSTACYMTPLASCQDARNLISTSPSGVYNLVFSGTSYPVWCEMINSEGWTLVMKASGSDSTWIYTNAIWSNQNTLNPNGFATGLDQAQLKSPMYWLMPFTQFRMGMRAPQSSGPVNWANVAYSASSLYSQIADGNRRSGLFDKGTWQALANGGSLQSNCNQGGFNVNYPITQIRIGFLSNEQNDCGTPDSFIGLGTLGNTSPNYASASPGGNFACCSACCGDRNVDAFFWILVR
eukprot:m.538063 g.538063  ORF g.538063 m.538063 type:complete len:814 (-) comp57626_c0_seq1:115-2556(-)